jgi:hypothetical protein
MAGMMHIVSRDVSQGNLHVRDAQVAVERKSTVRNVG